MSSFVLYGLVQRKYIFFLSYLHVYMVLVFIYIRHCQIRKKKNLDKMRQSCCDKNCGKNAEQRWIFPVFLQIFSLCVWAVSVYILHFIHRISDFVSFTSINHKIMDYNFEKKSSVKRRIRFWSLSIPILLMHSYFKGENCSQNGFELFYIIKITYKYINSFDLLENDFLDMYSL